MVNTGKWDKFWEEFKKLPKIQPEVVKQRGIFGDGVIFAYKANEMNEGEVIDIDYLSPSNRHYKERYSGHFNNWLKRVYNHLDNYEYVVAAVVQAACYDLEKDYDKREFFLNDIAFASSEKFGRCVATYIPNKYTRYFHAVEDDWCAENEYYTEENGYDKHYKMGHPMNIRKYQDAAEYVHNLMKNIFCYYQFVEVSNVEDIKEANNICSWTLRCREYRRVSVMVKENENLTEIYPCSSVKFNGPITIRCEKHGIEYSVSVSDKRHEKDYMCPECRKELELLEAAEKEAARQKTQEVKLEQSKLRFESDINNFKAVGGQRFNNFYDYSLVDEDYRDFDTTKVRIIHPEYGVFEMTPAKHLRSVTGYNKSGVPNVPRAKEAIYVLDGSGNKMSVGDKVKWQVTGKPTWYHGTVTEIGNCFVKVQKTTDKKIVRKERDFLFVEE